MIKYFLISAVSILFAANILGTANAQRPRASIELACKHIAPIEQSYLTRHVTFSKSSKNLESRAVDQFIKKLDGAKIYLMKKDIAGMRKNLKGIFGKTKKRNCTAIEDAHKLFKKRVAERIGFVKKFLNDKYKFDKKVTFVLDPDKRKYPKNITEANAFHKKYIHFQISSYLATDMKLKEAKEQVIRNYERIQRRVKDYDQTDLWAIYLDAFARSLDPHSSYLSKDELEDFEIQMRLSLEGIGATLSSQDGFTIIEQLIAGGAAFRSNKLKPKDKIVAVAQGKGGKFENVIELDLRDVVRKIRGKKGTLVRLKILRKSGETTKNLVVNLVRDKIKLEDEAAAIDYIKKDWFGKERNIGLINLPSFYADNRKKGRSAAKDLKKILREANSKNVEAIVLDLSTNGGGSLDDAVKIAGLFFKTGNVVKQSHRDPARGELELADEDPAVDYAGPLVVLTSRISASASEIVAGTLQDYKRAIIVGGDHTFGKGSVQSVEPLPRGLGALKTTVGMFFTPGGNSTQHRGVNADIKFPSAYSTDEIGEKTLDYSLPPKKIKSFISKDAYVTAGPSKWKKVEQPFVTKLRKRSGDRIVKDKDFAKVKKNIAKAKKRGKVIKVSEVFKDDEDEEKNKKKDKDKDKDKKDKDRVLTKAEKKEKYLKRADIKEAVNIALDIVYLKEKSAITIGAKNPERKPQKAKNN